MSDGGKGSTRRPSQIKQSLLDDRWDTIFKKKCPVERVKSSSDKSLDSSQEWDEKRMDVIGSNGNVGYDLDQAYLQVEKDYA